MSPVAHPDAKLFIRLCLDRDPEYRPSVQYLLENTAWMRQHYQNDVQLDKRQEIQIGANILQFAKTSTP